MHKPGRSMIQCATTLVIGMTLGVFGAGAASADAKPRQVLIEPKIVEVSDSLVPRLGFQFVPPQATTDADSLGLPAPVRTAFGSSVLLLHEEQLLPKNGIDPNNLDAAPPGSVRITWSLDFFATHAGALAVEKARETNLTDLGFQALHNSRLRALGVHAFARMQPDTQLASQVWYAVDANGMLAIVDTGKFTPDALQSDQLKLFKELDKRYRAVPTLRVEPKLAMDKAGRLYLSAIELVIEAEPVFMDRAQHWDASTTGAQAKADAQPLVHALGRTEQQLLRIAGGYEPARNDVLVAVGALEVLNADLSDLGRLQTPRTSTWLQHYATDLARLTAASNQARSTLGLPAAAQ